MALTLDLPAHLEHELKEEAAREGVPASEHAALLLSICAALLNDAEATPFRGAVKEFLSRRSLDAEHLSTVFEELVAECLAVAPGDEELSRTIRRARYVSEPGRAGPSLRAWRDSLVHQPSDAAAGYRAVRRAGVARPRARGKYAHVAGTSEDFARAKQAEIAREEKPGA